MSLTYQQTAPRQLTGPTVLLVLDASPLIHQLYYVQKDEHSTDNVVSAFADRIARVQEQIQYEIRKPLECICSFDNNKPTFRNWVMPEYKANRVDKTPQIEREQVRECRHAVWDAMASSEKWERVMAPYGFESDDVLASYAAQSPGKVILHTIDKDAFQCLEEGRVAIIRRSNWCVERGRTLLEWFFERDLRQKFGFGPERFVDFQCIVGDSADNVSGVYSVGEKTAIKLMGEHQEPLDEWDVEELGLSEKKTVEFSNMLEFRLDILRRIFAGVTELDVVIPKGCIAHAC